MSPPLERELLEHGEGLRALARALVGADLADDVVQDTVAQALAAPPRAPGPIGGWLASIARRIAGRYRRSERRRLARERAAARPEALPGADLECGAREALQRLTAAVMALPAPFQGAILLRYLHGMTPRAIAMHSGEPLATVKSRLQRGLALLRERLQQEGQDWSATLAAGMSIEPAVAVTALTTGVLTMGMVTKFAAAAVVAASMTLAWWQWRMDPAARPASASALVPVPEKAGEVAAAAGANERAMESRRIAPGNGSRAASMRRPGFDRDGLAAAFGLTDHGVLDAAGKAAVRARLLSELDGTRANARRQDLDVDPEQGWLEFTNLLKYEEALTLLDEDGYLTIDSPALPTKQPANCNPMILMSAASIGGQRVGVLFPVEVPPVSVLAWALGNASAYHDAARTQAIAATVAAFNAQPLQVRERRIAEMSAAQEEIAALMRARARGEISQQQMFDRAAPAMARQAPNGTAVDREHQALRVR